MLYYYVCNTCKEVFVFKTQVKYCPNVNCKPKNALKKNHKTEIDHIGVLTPLDEYMVPLVNRLHKYGVWVASSTSGRIQNRCNSKHLLTDEVITAPEITCYTYTLEWVKLSKALERWRTKNKQKDLNIEIIFSTNNELLTYDGIQSNYIATIKLTNISKNPIENLYRYDKVWDGVLTSLGVPK